MIGSRILYLSPLYLNNKTNQFNEILYYLLNVMWFICRNVYGKLYPLSHPFILFFITHIFFYLFHNKKEWMKKGSEINMQNLTELEVENLRHLIGAHGTLINKLEQYAQECNDPQLTAMLQKDARDARNTKQQLISFLG